MIFCRKPDPSWTCKRWESRMQTELFMNLVYTFSLKGCIVIRWTNALIILWLIWDWKELAMHRIGQWTKNSSRRSYVESSRIKELKGLCCAEAERVKQVRTDELYIQQKVSLQWINSRFKFRNYKTRGYPTFPVSVWVFQVLVEWQAAILACILMRGTHLTCRETFLKTYLLRVNLQQLSVEVREVQHNASPCLWTQGDLPIEQMNWSEILRICSNPHRDLQGSLQLGILPLMQKELIRRIAWLNSRGIKTQPCISINSLILLHVNGGKWVSRPKYVLVQTFSRTLRCGSKKWIWSTQWTILRRRGQLEGTDSRIWDAWCEDCVYLEKAAPHACPLPKKSECRRATRSNIRPIRTRETNCIHDLRMLLRVTGAHEAVLVHTDMFSFSWHGNDIQDFDTRWDRTLLSTSEVPKDSVLESLYKMRIRESVQLQIWRRNPSRSIEAELSEVSRCLQVSSMWTETSCGPKWQAC